jgi:hypothetical protein
MMMIHRSVDQNTLMVMMEWSGDEEEEEDV